MSEPCCTAVTRGGAPCAARPLPESDFCLFHDPSRQERLAQSRSQGGSTPRRRARRYPRTLDYKHLAELLSELFVDALNEPAPLDAPRLRALTGLAKVLLQAVGRPKGTYEIYLDRSEPDAEEDHLLRLYPPDPPEIARLLAAEARTEPAPQHPDPSDPSDPSDPAPDPEPLRAPAPPGTPRRGVGSPLAAEQDPQQDGNRASTGTSATERSIGSSSGAVPPGPAQGQSQSAKGNSPGSHGPAPFGPFRRLRSAFAFP